MTKKQLLPGVTLGFSLFLNVTVWAGPITDMQPPVKLQVTEETTTETAAARTPNGPHQDRLTSSDPQSLGARWSQIGQTNQPDLLAFTSTFAANRAAVMLNHSGNSLSFASFGRVPYHQMLALTNQVSITSGKATPASTASLPEPASLTLLGAGLAALAAGLRKRKKKSSK